MHFGSGHLGYVYIRENAFNDFCNDGTDWAGALNLETSFFNEAKRFFST